MLISISIDHYSNVISPADSVATPLDYINKTLELGQKAVSCCQHSGTIGYWEYYTLCKKNNLKMIYAAEVYAVLNEDKTDRTNAHLIIIAKNRSGFESMNKLISWANVNNFYYKARITFNKLIEYCNPDDIIITTGCIGGLWKYENSLEIINQLYTHFKDNFYLEIQCHNNIKQTDLNKHIYKLHKELGIKMIVGLDSHAVNEEQVKERAYYLEAKGMVYEDDGSDWNLDFPDYDTLIERFKTQNAIPIEDVIIALNNTNILLENEDLVFDKEIKLPTIYPGKTQIEKNNILKDILNKEYYKYCKDMTKEDKHKYIDAIRYEYDIIEKTNMTDYFLLNYEIIKQGRLNGGVITQTGRGCFTENAIVQTSNSLKKISEIVIGDKVLTKSGKFEKVLDTMQYEIEESMIEFEYRVQGSSNKKYNNVCTTDHKILTKDGWKEAKDLTLNDLLCYPKIEAQDKEIVYDLANYTNFKYDAHYIYEEHHSNKPYMYSPTWMEENNIMSSGMAKGIIDGRRNSVKGEKNIAKLFKVCPFKTLDNYAKYCKKHGHTKRKIKRFITMNELNNLFIGCMYADGWTNGTDGLGFAVNRTSKNIVNRRVFYKFAESVGLDVYVNKSKTRNLDQLFINSSTLYNWFEAEFFKSKKGVDKIFNENLLQQSEKNLYWLKKGLDICDGSKNEATNKMCYDSTSLSLIGSYKIMNNILNNDPMALDVRLARVDDRGYNNKESYKIRRPIDRKYYMILKDEKYWYLPITKINLIENFKGKVYDMTIENDHSYIINNVVVHNSSVGFLICKMLGLTDFDRLKSEVTLYPERFMSTTRVLQTKSLADIDLNFSDPKPFILAQKKVLGEDNSYYMVAFGKLKAKSAFKMYAKANNIDYQTANELVKQLDKYEKELKYNKTEDEDDEENFIDPHDFIDEKYWSIYDGSVKYQGIIDSISPSPCSHLLYDKPISTHIGLINVGKEICCCIDGNTASEEFKYLKNDLLTVTVVDIIDKVFKKIGVPIIPIDELRSICKNNSKVWDIYKDGFTVGINQVEKDKTTKKVMDYKPKNLSELCAFIAGIRPSFQSMIDILISRKDFSYGLEEFDRLIQTEELPQSFILYQEQIMKTLNYAGFDLGETYTIIKQISKKKQGVIEPLKDKFIKGFIKKIMEEGDANVKL